MKTTIVVDLDGTVCDCSHRVDLAKAKLWDDFHAGCVGDELFADTASLLDVLSNFYVIIAITGRTEKHRLISEAWLSGHNVPIDELFMRADDDFRPAAEIKLAILEQRFGSKEKVLENVLFCLEDTDKIVEAFRNYGLPCWQVRQGAY